MKGVWGQGCGQTAAADVRIGICVVLALAPVLMLVLGLYSWAGWVAESRASDTEVREGPSVRAAGALGSWSSLELGYEGNINLKLRKGYEVGPRHRRRQKSLIRLEY